jgi:lysophospholipase
MSRYVTIFLALAIPTLAFGIGQASYDADWQALVAPYLAEHSTQGDLVGTGGVRLRYLAIEQPEPRAAIVFLGGHAESFYKYYELFYDLRDLGVSIYALDPRGQGSSQHLLADLEKSHVDRWQDYVADLELFVHTVVKVRTTAKLIAMGHSLGGGIIASYLEQHPGDFDSAILSAPLVGHAAGGAILAFLAVIDIGKNTSYVPGGGPFVVQSFEANKETHSRVRHLRKFQDYADHPETRTGYPTVHWMNETRRMAASALAGAAKIAVPLLVLQDTEDAYVSARALETFCARAKDCRRVVLSGARHEMLIETDAIRDRVLAEIRGFVDVRAPARG